MVIWVRSPTRRGAAARQSLAASLPGSAIPGFGAPVHHPKLCPAERGAAFRLGDCPGKRLEARPARGAGSPPTGSGRAPEQGGPLWVPGPGWRHQQASFGEEPTDPAPPALGAVALAVHAAMNRPRSRTTPNLCLVEHGVKIPDGPKVRGLG